MPAPISGTKPAGRIHGSAGAAAATLFLLLTLGGPFLMRHSAADEPPPGPRAAAWEKVQRALDEGKPRSAAEALSGVEAEATQAKAWAEVARAIATRILTETGDRPGDDPERLIRLAAALEKAPAETRGVLEAIRANWTWGYFQANRWRYQQRTQGGSDGKDLAKIAEWDLPTIVKEIRARFAAAVGAPDSPERAALQKLPVAEWSAIIEKGKMADAYRPTVWDVIVRDAIEFSSSGERGLVAPEDAFELEAASPALGTPEEFCAWKPETEKGFSDIDSPLVDTLALYRDLLDFHRADQDRSAFLAADLDRILWASGAVVSAGEPADLADRKRAALEKFIERAGDHETASLGRFHMASLVRQGENGEPGDLVEARKIALAGADAYPTSPGGALCKNLVVEIEAPELSLQTETSWADPWPVVRVSYRNLARVHLRLAKADFQARLKAGKPHFGWLDDADRKAIFALPAVKAHAADLPATPDFQQRHEDLPVAAAFGAGGLEPGAYWVIASQKENFGGELEETARPDGGPAGAGGGRPSKARQGAEALRETDNVVFVSMVWVTRLAIVAEQGNGGFADPVARGPNPAAARGGRGAPVVVEPVGRSQGGPVALAGHVVDIASGEPVAGATVKAFVRGDRGGPPPFAETATATTDKEGRYELSVPQQKEVVVAAAADLGGKRHETATGSTHVWRNEQPAGMKSITLVTDRGIHRPGQIVHYKGIACASDFVKADYHAIADREIVVTFRDSNGREVAKATHKTSANGSFHGTFPIATGALPGQWSIQAQAPGNDGFGGGVAVRVEEYKRPKFKVDLAKPEKAVPLGGEVSLSGTATTYTGVAVGGAKVKWHVVRNVRWPFWCRWFFPWLPFNQGGQRIARGTVLTDDAGKFTVTFPARPDKSVPKESLPVFTYTVTADVTDTSGETRSDTETVSVGYTDVEATVSAGDWLAVEDGKPAAVKLTLATTTLDGQPREATGTLTVSRLVQPAAVVRHDLFGGHGGPRPMPMRGRRGGAIAPQPIKPDPADVNTWAVGEQVTTEKITTDKATGKAEATATLPAGIYKAVFEIPAKGDVPAVRAETVVEVVDTAAAKYGVRRAFVMRAKEASVAPNAEFTGFVGTGYDAGRSLVEIAQAGKTLARFWTEPGRTQWPVSLKVTDAHRGGFTVRAWMVRDGRLHSESRTIDVPWTTKKLAIGWERFTRRLEPGAKEIWRAKITSILPLPLGEGRGEGASVAPPPDSNDATKAPSPGLRPPSPEGRGQEATPAVAEFLALAYDQSLDALAQHAWPGDGLMGMFRRESSWANLAFTNQGVGFNHVLGHFAHRHVDVPETTYRVLREPFGSPMRGGWIARAKGFGSLGRNRMLMAAPGMPMDGVPMAAALVEAQGDAVEYAEADARDKSLRKKAGAGEDKQAGGPQEPGSPPQAAAAVAPPPRKNLVETAFFLPTLSSDTDGVVTIEFALPDTLTTWQFKGLAHDAALRSGTIVDTCVSAKDLMVEPITPRFLREGDVVQIPVKVSNTSTGRLAGSVKFALADARTDRSRDDLVDGPREQAFDLAAGESKPVVFTVKVADGTEALRYLATGSAGKAADGEEAFVVVLPRRVLVSESVPVTIRGPGERKVSLERLAQSGGTDIQSQSLVVQATSNPAWYAVLALPAIMEQTDESTETLFTRLYANSLARHLATSDPRIARVFEQWKGTGALESPLEKNADLVKTLLAETPWVRDAADEKEARARIALLFDATRAGNETQAALARLQNLRNGDGGWPWFPGGRTCDSVTLGIIAGFGQLRAAGVKIDVQPALQAIPWLDGRLVEERNWAIKAWKDKPDEIVLTPIGVYALYARSFFTKDVPPQGETAAAIQWGFDVARKCWMKLDGRLSQGQLAIALARSGDKPTALSIIDSLKQRAVDADVKPGAEKESWQGMWWRDPHPGWWSWNYAPIASQSMMVEAFDEVAGDKDAVEALKVWLLSQKRTSHWRGSRATADAVGALLGRGADLLASQELVTVDVGGERVEPVKVEAGTGFFEERFTRREITPAMANITVTKKDKGVAFGGVHWQYLDDISKVPAAGREELSIEKQLFIKRMTKAGPELVPVPTQAGVPAPAGAKPGVPALGGAGAEAQVKLGDELVVRLVVKSDRDYEFLELADHRPSLTEPMDVLSGWRYGDGAAWYVAIRDTSTQMFFERLPRGTHVFEYSLRAAHRGTASSGFAKIQSRYAPEFNAHSASVALEVGD
jgi:hypothetical protein